MLRSWTVSLIGVFSLSSLLFFCLLLFVFQVLIFPTLFASGVCLLILVSMIGNRPQKSSHSISNVCDDIKTLWSQQYREVDDTVVSLLLPDKV